MSDRISGRLEDALIAARHVRTWVDGSGRDDLEQNMMLQSAVLLQLERIGEALRTVRDRDATIECDFGEIHGWIAMRHIISHA